MRAENYSGTIEYDEMGTVNLVRVGGLSTAPGPGFYRTGTAMSGTGRWSLAAPVTIASAHSAFAWVWINDITVAGDGGSGQTIFGWLESGNSVRLLSDETAPSGRLMVSIWIGAGPEVTAIHASVPQFVNNTWAHVGYTFNGSTTAILYANGATFTTGANGGFSVPNALLIGARTTTAGHITGRMAGVVTYNRVLAASEVQELYRAGA
jgi:hypothetical protein